MLPKHFKPVIDVQRFDVPLVSLNYFIPFEKPDAILLPITPPQYRNLFSNVRPRHAR